MPLKTSVPKKRAVTLLWYAKTSLGWKRVPPLITANNRVKHGWATVAGKPEHCPIGRYQLRFYLGGKLKYENAGETIADAQAALQRRVFHLQAKDAGVKVAEDETRKLLRKEANAFVRDAESRGKTEAPLVYKVTTDEFFDITPKLYVDEITRDDVLAFHTALRKRGLSDRTVANKDARLRAFLKYCGVDLKTTLPPKPRYETKLPTVYSAEELRKILDAADPYMRLAIELGLMCGLREQELCHLEWADVDFADSVLRVRSKPLMKFKIKDSEERDTPVPSDLLQRLQDWHVGKPENGLVLPSKSGGVNGKLLRQLKRLAKSTGLNCGQCKGCKSPLQECGSWQLHKLRRTYATTLLRNGMDLATVQHFMGHSDLATTMRYLRPAAAETSQARINAIKWA